MRELPRQYAGDIHVEGMPQPIRVRLVPHDFTTRGEKTLEFNSVQYSVLGGVGAVETQGDATIHGTIGLPDLAVRIESLGNLTNGDDFMKVDSFHGTFSADLQDAEADWTTSLGQKGHLKMHAEK